MSKSITDYLSPLDHKTSVVFPDAVYKQLKADADKSNLAVGTLVGAIVAKYYDELSVATRNLEEAIADIPDVVSSDLEGK